VKNIGKPRAAGVNYKEPTCLLNQCYKPIRFLPQEFLRDQEASNLKGVNEMKRKKYNLISLILIIAGYFVILTAHPLHAQLADSAWAMFKHDTRHTGLSPYAGSENNTLKWKYALPSAVVKESPAIGSDGTIYIPMGNSLFAINRDGSFKWRSDGHSMGRSTPAISSDGTIYIPWGNGLFAVNPDGTLKWKYDTSSYFSNNYSSPTIGTNGIVYFGFGVDLLAIKPDGNLLWKYRVGEEVNSSPAIGDDGTIYVRGREDYLIALNSDGTEKWVINLGSTLSQTNMSPVIGPDGTIYTFGLMNAQHPSFPDLQTTGLHAINPDGTTKWVFSDIDFDDQSIHMTPAIDKNGTIYLSGSFLNVWGSQLFCAINQSGILQWTFELTAPDCFSSSSPAIDVNGNIYFGTWGNQMYALNPNGTLKWKFETRNNIDSSPAIGENGMIYFGSSDGYLYAIGQDPPICGDGLVTVPEECDDGNNGNEDGCSSTCTIEPGWSCSGSPSLCSGSVGLSWLMLLLGD
jgi:cysteine-rich repeat protein